MKQQQPRTQHEYRVTWQRVHWEKPRSRFFQMEAYAIRFADRMDAGQDRWGLLKELKIERRPVGAWVEHDG